MAVSIETEGCYSRPAIEEAERREGAVDEVVDGWMAIERCRAAWRYQAVVAVATVRFVEDAQPIATASGARDMLFNWPIRQPPTQLNFHG